MINHPEKECIWRRGCLFLVIQQQEKERGQMQELGAACGSGNRSLCKGFQTDVLFDNGYWAAANLSLYRVTILANLAAP